jgi:hypothetical protein
MVNLAENDGCMVDRGGGCAKRGMVIFYDFLALL